MVEAGRSRVLATLDREIIGIEQSGRCYGAGRVWVVVVGGYGGERRGECGRMLVCMI